MDLEDELGDVLEKAIKVRRLNEDTVAGEAGVSVRQLKDAFDYRYDLTDGELLRLAAVLHLNEVGLLALARNHYPKVNLPRLPFCLRPLSLRFGVGKVNAYLIKEKKSPSGLLFDTGYVANELSRTLSQAGDIPEVLFLTHGDRDHLGGLAELKRHYPDLPLYGPCPEVGAEPLSDGQIIIRGSFQIKYFDTCGHSNHHGSYLVTSTLSPPGNGVLIGGDLLFAGSIGGAFYCRDQLLENVRRILRTLPPETILAPGHGPLSTIGHERKFNPFSQ